MTERVVITGASVISPIGNSLEEFWKALETGRKGIGYIRDFSPEFYPSRLGAQVRNLESDSGDARTPDNKRIFFKRALRELLDRYPVVQTYQPSDRILNIGAGLDFFDLESYIDNSDRTNRSWRRYSLNTHQFIKDLADECDIRGGVNVYVSACVASNHALGQSYRMLKTGENKIVISGGVDSMLNPLHYMGFYKLGALSDWRGNPQEACRPFDKKRCGLVLGEGAALFLLQKERLASPETILAEIAGFGSTMDACSVTDPEPDGSSLAQAAVNAISDAGIAPEDIDCVHLHGTGTPKDAPAEAHAMKRIFGQRFREIPVFSLKGQIGHLIAACGAVELLAAVYSLQTQTVPVTVNCVERDPEAPLNVVIGKSLSKKISCILKLNTAFGGQNAAFVVKKYG